MIGTNCDLKGPCERWVRMSKHYDKRRASIADYGDSLVMEIDGVVPSRRMEGRTLKVLDTCEFWWVVRNVKNSCGGYDDLGFLDRDLLRIYVNRLDPVQLTLVIPFHRRYLSIQE